MNLQLILKVDETNFNANYSIGKIFKNRGDYQNALRYFYDAEKVQKSDSQLLINIIRTLIKLKKYDEAITYCDKLFDSNNNKFDIDKDLIDVNEKNLENSE